MEIQFFNFWYFLFIILSFGTYIGLYFLLRNKSEKTKKIVLFSILVFGLVLHFTKNFYPPYSTDKSRYYRDIFFVNICGASIALFPFIFISKSDKAKDYMFYLGVISGILSILVPLEPIQKVSQSTEWIDIIRFYIHHTEIWVVPLLMVTLKLHKLNYKRILCVPTQFMIVLLFIILNQFFQSELGFIPLRNNNFFDINWKNTSFIYGPGKESFVIVFTILCPKIFRTVPVGVYAGQEKYWPWFWLIVPVYVYLTILSFLISLIFDGKHFVSDMKILKQKIKDTYDNIFKKNVKEIAQNTEIKKQNNEIIIDESMQNDNILENAEILENKNIE